MATQKERNDALVESLKEGGRLALLGLIGYLLTEGVIDVLLNAIFGVKLSMEVKVVLSGIATTGLKSLDKWLHETAKNEPAKDRNEGVLGEKGLTGF